MVEWEKFADYVNERMLDGELRYDPVSNCVVYEREHFRCAIPLEKFGRLHTGRPNLKRVGMDRPHVHVTSEIAAWVLETCHYADGFEWEHTHDGGLVIFYE